MGNVIWEQRLTNADFRKIARRASISIEKIILQIFLLSVGDLLYVKWIEVIWNADLSGFFLCVFVVRNNGKLMMPAFRLAGKMWNGKCDLRTTINDCRFLKILLHRVSLRWHRDTLSKWFFLCVFAVKKDGSISGRWFLRQILAPKNNFSHKIINITQSIT